MSTTPSPALDRRGFLKLSALASGGLMIAGYFRGADAFAAEVVSPADAKATDFKPNAFIRIAPNGKVFIMAHKPEMGQGIRTSLPMIVAEELDAKWSDVTVVAAPYDQVYGGQSAGGSTSTPTSYANMRKLGASARAVLVEAAAQQLNVPASELTTENSTVVHAGSGKRLGYGELVAKAATLSVPASVALKDPKDFKLLGQRVTGYQNTDIVTGKPVFGIDVKVPGMAYAVFEKCPVFGGKVVSANLDVIKAQSGIKDAFVVEGTANITGLNPGVAIIGDSTWSVFNARKQLQVQWDEGTHANDNTAGFNAQAAKLAKESVTNPARSDGDVPAALASAAKVVEASYSYPFISHANLEPQNCTAWVQGDKCELWAPTQNPASGAQLITRTLGIPAENIKCTITRSGGGFGRRLDGDPMLEAAAISKQAGLPIKLMWTREDDLRHDHFRPGGYHFLKAGLDADGKVVAWHNRMIGFQGSGGTIDGNQFPARFVPNFLTEVSTLDVKIPMGPWRAPGNCAFGFVMQGFIDELAHAAGKDPLEFRLTLLGDKDLVGEAPQPGQRGGGQYNAGRMKAVLKLLAEKSDWGKTKFPKGKGAGIAFHFSHQGYIAQVAEVTVSKRGELKVDRVVCVCDVGSQIVNLSGAENQVEGSIVDGLGVALYCELTFDKGRIVQSNFHDYPLIRMPDAPTKIETHFLKSEYPPTGLGEPALPPLAPAVANAIFAATGKRLRDFPFSKSDLRWT